MSRELPVAQQQAGTREYRVRVPRMLLWAIQEVFAASLVTYLVFFLIDSLVDSFVSKQFNTNILLWIVIASGAALVLMNPRVDAPPNVARPKQMTAKTVAMIAVFGVVAAGIVVLKTKSFGRLSYVIAGISGALVFLLSLVLLFGDDDDSKEQ